MTSTTSILLQGGVLLIHDSDDHVNAVRADLLIEGNKIAKINEDIRPPSNHTRLIDCSNKVVSPGFIDTHRHMWQSQLKGRHADGLFLDYLPTGNFAASLFSPQDIFWGELSGGLESIDAGTTTVVDHAHMNYSADHAKYAVSALVSSGIRSIFCYTANPRVQSWSPKFSMESDLIPDWFLKQLRELAHHQPYGHGRVHLGFGWDNYSLPKEVVVKIFEEARNCKVKLITSHAVRRPPENFSLVKSLVEWDLLGPDILLSHLTNPIEGEPEQLAQAGAHVSSTPSTELQMACGDPICFRPELYPICSLGVDCHSAVSADIPGQMRLALQCARGKRNQRILDTNKIPRDMLLKVEQAFNLGTINGARAVRMESEIGSLAEGKLADIVIFDTQSPAMICASDYPVAAIVLHSSTRDVDTVIVDGIVRKQSGKLHRLHVDKKFSGTESHILEWNDVAGELLKSQDGIQEKAKHIDYGQVQESLVDSLGIPSEMFYDEL